MFESLYDELAQTMSFKGGIPQNMQINSELQFNAMVPKQATPEQKKVINRCLNEIDALLTRECMFCGPILIDMIDNDIEGGNTGREFAVLSTSRQKKKKSSEWDII